MYRFCKEKLYVDVTRNEIAVGVVCKQWHQRYNMTGSRVYENTWNFATVNFAGPVKQREY